MGIRNVIAKNSAPPPIHLRDFAITICYIVDICYWRAGNWIFVVGDLLSKWYLFLEICCVIDICYLSCWSFLIVHLLPFLLKLISIGHTVVLKSNIRLGSSDVIKLSNSEIRLRIRSWGNSTWTSSLTLAPSILSPLTTTCNSWVFWLIDWKERKKPAPLQYWLLYFKKRENLLLPNLNGLLRVLLGGAIGLQGLDDRELPRVPSPILVQSMVKRWWRNKSSVFYLENPFPADADPCPGLRHLVQVLLKDGKLWMKMIWDLFHEMDLLLAWKVFPYFLLLIFS